MTHLPSATRLFIYTLLVTFVALPCLGQTAALPSELAFLKAPLKPYNITYEPWANLLMPPGNYGANGVGKMVGGKHWVFPVIVPDGKDTDAIWTIMKPAFLNNGWTAVREWTAGGRFL